MSLHADLLEQARHLARRESKRPKQASLRRSIATAYYALFHLLVNESCAFLVAGGGRQQLRNAMARAFAHSEMVAACKAFAKQSATSHSVKDCLRVALPSGTISDDLRKLATAFVDLQQARHEADYDPSAAFTRQHALGLVAQVEAAFDSWKRIRNSVEADVFRVALLIHQSIRS